MEENNEPVPPLAVQPEPQPSLQKKWIIPGAAVLALIVVGVGFFLWQQRSRQPIAYPEPTPLMATPTTEPAPTESVAASPLPQNESGQVGRYLNKSLGVDFAYPVEWGELTFDQQGEALKSSFTELGQNNGTVYFTPSLPSIAQVALHIPSETIVFTEYEEGITPDPEDVLGRGTRLYRLRADGRTGELIYTVEQKYEDWGGEGKFSYVRFSPKGRYVDARLITSIESSVTKVFDLETGHDLFGTICYHTVEERLLTCPLGQDHNSFENPIRFFENSMTSGGGVVWSEDEAVLAMISYDNFLGGTGMAHTLFVSDYRVPSRLNVAFTRNKLVPPLPEGFTNTVPHTKTVFIQPLDISNVVMEGEGSVNFNTSIYKIDYGPEQTTVLETRSFEYNSKTKELKQLSYTPLQH